MSAIRHTRAWWGLGLAGGLALLAAGCSFDASNAGSGQQDGDDDDPIDAFDAAVTDEPDAAVPDDEPDAAPDDEPDAAVEPAGLSAPFAAAAPVIDGDVDPVWDDAEELSFFLGDGELELSAPHPAYEPSATVRFRLLHDDDFLYVLVEVEDDLPGIIEIDDDIFTDDGVALFVDGAGDLGGEVGADDHTFIVNAAEATEHYGAGVLLADVEHTPTLDGYVGEYALPKTDLSADGDRIGFNLALFDNDAFGGPTIDAAVLWKSPEVPRCDDCCDSGGDGGDDDDDEPMPWCDTTLLLPVALDAP